MSVSKEQSMQCSTMEVMSLRKYPSLAKIVSILLLTALILTSATALTSRDSSGHKTVNPVLNYNEQILSPVSFGGDPVLSIGTPTTISGIDGPNAMTYDPNNGYTYVADFSTDSVTVLNGNSQITTYPLQSGYEANGISYNSYYNVIYVSLYSASSGEVAEISPSTGDVQSYIYLGNAGGAAGIASLPDGYTYVSLSSSNYVDVIHNNVNFTDIKVPRGPEWIGYDPINGYVYVISTASSPATISIINPSSNSVIGSLSSPVGTLVYQNGMIYDFGTAALQSINGLTTTIPPMVSSESEPVSSYPYAASAGPGNNAFVALNGTNNVDIMDLSGSESYSLGIVSDPGTSPQGILYNPIAGYLYVANFKSDSVDVYSVQVLEKVTFTESGLPYGTEWGITVNGESNSSSTDSVAFYLENGSYQYTATTPIDIDGSSYLTTSSGTVNVDGTTGVQVDYHQSEFTTTFIESALPSGTEWSVTFNGNTQSSTGTSISFSTPEGSYSYTVNPPAGYSANPNSGTITVSASSEISISFKSTATMYADLNFTESGLPTGATWYVNIAGVSNYSYDQPEISLILHSGVYSYEFYSPGYTASPSSGSVDLTSNETLNVQFTANSIPTYKQTFNEKGLNSGEKWYIQISGGANFSSNTDSLNISLQAGTYSYNVYSVGFSASPPSGVFSLPSSTAIDLTFSPEIIKQENLTFNENGLSQGYEWYIEINGRNFSSVDNNITVALPQGSYTYTAYAFGYTSHPQSGTIDVQDSPLSVTIEFTFVSFTKNETMVVSYDGELYNFSSDVNYKFFNNPNLSLSQDDLFRLYIDLSLTNSKAYLDNVTIVRQSNGASVSGSLAQNIMDSLLIWSQMNYTSLQESYGSGSIFYKNLQTLLNGQWTDTIGSILPEILNFAIIAGQIGTIATEAYSGDVSSLTSILGPIYSILNGVNVVSDEYSQETAQNMLQTLESNNIVSGSSYNTTTALSNLSHLTPGQFSKLLSSLYNDTNPPSSVSGTSALSDVTSAFGDFLQYSPFYGVLPSDSISTVVSDASSLIQNSDGRAASGAAGDIGSEIANSLMDQYISGIQSSSVSMGQQVTGDINTADSQFSLQLGPGIVLGMASALDQNFLIPQGELLASLAGSQETLASFYNAINSLVPDINGATPDLSSALDTAYIAQMIKTTWLQWYSISSQLNGKDYSPPGEQSQWNTIIQYLSGNQYNAIMFLRSLDLLAGDIVNNNTEPIYTNQINNFFSERTSKMTLDDFSVYDVIEPSLLSQIATSVYNYLDDAWAKVSSYASKLLSNLNKLGAYLVNGVETFDSAAYSELSDLSSGALHFFSDIGYDVSAGWKWLVNVFVIDGQYVLSNSTDYSGGGEWIALYNGTNYYEYANSTIYSSSLWAYAVVSGSGGLLVTNISAGQNISIEVGSAAKVSPLFSSTENRTAVEASYTQEPGIIYDYGSRSVNGSLQFTTVLQKVSFELINHPSGTKWSLRIMYQNGTIFKTITGNGSFANISLNSGYYRYVFTPGSNKYYNASGELVVNGSSVVQIIDEKAKPYSPILLYIFIVLIIIVLSSLSVIALKRYR